VIVLMARKSPIDSRLRRSGGVRITQ
jgi:hypothetical protein